MRTIWTTEKIKEGFERFNDQYARLPTGPEIDQLEYLPSSRWIQMKFGGLEKLRTLLGYEHTHFGKGIFRSEIAHRVNNRGRNAELSLESTLQDIFGEVFVHTEKMFDTSKKNRVDFYVYSPDGNFGIDIFYPETMRNLESNVNIKMHKYRNFSGTLYFVVANESLKQKDFDTYINSKVLPLAKGTELVTLETLLRLLKDKRAYPNPLK